MDIAREKLRAADLPVLGEYAARIMGKLDPQLHRYRDVGRAAAPVAKVTERMPSRSVQLAMYARDGWRCRFCGCRVVLDRARRAMRAHLPDAVPWSEGEGHHAAFYALSGSVDHVVPHCAGGGNDLENIVTACWPCQFGRSHWLIEEVGLIDPRSRTPVVDSWDGLTRLLSIEQKVMTPGRSGAGDSARAKTFPGRHRSIPTTGRSRRLAETASFDVLDAAVREPCARLAEVLDGCADIGVSWGVKKVMVARMIVGGACITFFGVLPDGTVEIPWSIGPEKDLFRDFAEAIAGALPGAEYYDTPKIWSVSKANKERFQVAELLGAADAIRSALEVMHAKLQTREVSRRMLRLEAIGLDDPS